MLPPPEERLALIGNAPSSGSSLLADLLDATPISACGRETAVFANHNLYRNFRALAANPRLRSECSCIYSKYVRTYFRNLVEYGFTEESFTALLRATEDPASFFRRFRQTAIVHRGLPADSVIFEKTPQNISCIGEFLSISSTHHFIFVVRDPIYVYQSLRRRSFTPLRAAGAWLFDIAKYLKFRNHPRVIEIRYEDFVLDPYRNLAAIVERLTGQALQADELKSRHHEINLRAKRRPGIETWKLKPFGPIRSANTHEDPAYVRELAQWLDLSVSPTYARAHQIKSLSLRAAIHQMNYHEAEARLVAERVPPYRLSPEDHQFLLDKYRQSVPGRKVRTKWERWRETHAVWPSVTTIAKNMIWSR